MNNESPIPTPLLNKYFAELWRLGSAKVTRFQCQNIYVIFELKNTKNQRKSEFWSSPSLLPPQYLYDSTSAFEWI